MNLKRRNSVIKHKKWNCTEIEMHV